METQIANCQEFINGISQLLLTNVYREDNVSGMFTDRPEYQKMINLAKTGGLDVIVVMKLDRFSRDYANGEQSVRQLRACGCIVLSLDMKIPDTPVEELTKGILMLQNQYQVRVIASDTMKVEMNNVKNGLSAGGRAPYGYSTIEKRYCINHDEESAVRLMFREVAEGKSYKQIIEHLDKLRMQNERREIVQLFDIERDTEE